MTKFVLTVNMPSHNGKTPHLITCEHPARSIEEFISAFDESDFFIVNEIYKPDDRHPNGHEIRVAINYRVIGKIKMWG